MKSPSEVCKIVGITRKTLRGYIEEGLAVPTVIDENTYQHFDDDAIRKIILAKVFQDAGYTRRQTKAIFDSDAVVLEEAYGKVIDTLREKQKKIDGQIRTVRLLRIESRLSEAAQEALYSIDLVDTYQGQDFKSCLDGLIARLSELAGEIDSYDLDAYLLFWYSLVVVGLVAGREDGGRIAEVAEEAFANFCLLMNHLDGFSGEFEQIERARRVELFGGFVEGYLQDDELVCEVEAVCGEGSAQAILQEVRSWAERANEN